jgi:HEAT repeat protein
MGRKAAWAKPDEQERISGELAAAFPVEADPLIRLEIVRALDGYPTAAAASTLDAALGDSDGDVRIAACKVWGERGGPEAVAKLQGVLASDLDQDVRLAAARALGETGDPAAVSALGDALADADPAMQYRAVQSLRSVTGEDFGNDVNRWRQYVRGESPAPENPTPIVQRFRRLF